MRWNEARRARKAAEKTERDRLWLERMSRDALPRPRVDGKPPVRFERTGGWGNTLTWFHYEKGSETQRMYGFRSRLARPVIGDHLHTPMEGGRVGLWVFTNVEPCNNPDDMFFADVRWWGYVDELDPAPDYQVPRHPFSRLV